MKNNLLFLLLFVSSFVFAQTKSATEFINEKFDATTLPVGWTVENYPTKWTISSSANAGGVPNELMFTYTTGTLTTRFISPAFDLTGVTALNLSYKQFIDHYGTGYSVGVATSGDNGTTWHIVKTQSPSANVGPENVDLAIINDDISSATFKMCFFLSGNAYQINNWYIDDVLLVSPAETDLSVQSIETIAYLEQGNQTIQAIVKNTGVNAITSYDISYQIDEETIYTDNVTGVNIANLGYDEIDLSEQWAATPGNYNLKVWISNINNDGDDDVLENNTLVKFISVATQTTTNLPLFESFTSATCPPCATFNNSFFNSFLANNEGDLAIIKYQMNWPGTGDIYYTAEGGVRRSYYGVAVVPELFAGGAKIAASSSGVNGAFPALQEKAAFIDITSNFDVEETTISVNIDIMPYITASDFRVQVAVVEKTTTGNVGSNGETSFHYVMMKMLPNASGTTANFVAEQIYNLQLTQNLGTTNIEEFEDLAVVVFIQNNATKEVFQSCIAQEGEITPVASSNILDGATNVAVDTDITIEFSQPVRLADDSEITNENINTFISLSDNSVKADIDFEATINETKDLITISPLEDLPYNSDISLELIESAVENYSDVAVSAITISFTTELENSLENINANFRVYPNPVSDILNIEAENFKSVEIYNIIGVLVHKSNLNKIDVSQFATGTYTLKINTSSESIFRKINIVK